MNAEFGLRERVRGAELSSLGEAGMHTQENEVQDVDIADGDMGMVGCVCVPSVVDAEDHEAENFAVGKAGDYEQRARERQMGDMPRDFFAGGFRTDTETGATDSCAYTYMCAHVDSCRYTYICAYVRAYLYAHVHADIDA